MTYEVASAAEFDSWVHGLHAERVHGPGDQLGSLNHLDDAARARGRDCLRTGVAISLAMPLRPGPTLRRSGESAFALTTYAIATTAAGDPMPDGFAMFADRVELDCHGGSNTHVDALNHVAFHGAWYDGSPVGEPPVSGSVLPLAEFGIFTRAVHADICAVRGTSYVELGRPVTGDEIDKAVAAAGLEFRPGDALLLDCGRDRYESEVGSWDGSRPRPGVGPEAARWMHEHRPGLVCWDMLDGQNPQNIVGPVHQLSWATGLVLVDNCTFAAARSSLQRPGHGAAALVVAPLPIEGATGSNVNPLLLL
ncbi:hypothetical protein GCM10009836_56590 [Pseudonocardia ailaonensis]|uniref:Cyclase n=1 Tax=Pseudonocardia ailaonensis TaxID=367279 RepID=A0ABN2NI97_9PSEU